jgi:hypothetical protein
MTKKLGPIGLVALGFVACTPDIVESEDVRTSGMYAKFEVLATGNGKTNVSGRLTAGGVDGPILELSAEDRLVCTSAGTAKRLTKQGDSYQSTFVGDDGGTEFVFALDRSDEDQAAPKSVVTLPDPFTIGGVVSTDVVSRAIPLTLTWEVSGTKDPTTYTLAGDCLVTSKGTVSTDGSLTIEASNYTLTPAAERAETDPADDSENCTVTLCFERERRGTLDPVFAKNDGGEISAIQRRCTEFLSTR